MTAKKPGPPTQQTRLIDSATGLIYVLIAGRWHDEKTGVPTALPATATEPPPAKATTGSADATSAEL